MGMNQQNAVKPELKAERVQGPEVQQQKRLPRPDDTFRPAALLTPAQAQQRLKAERVQLRLARMPGWTLQPGGKLIDRVRKFSDPLVAASYMAFAALLARQSNQRLWASVQGSTITVTLPGRTTRGAEGITEDVLDLAEQLG